MEGERSPFYRDRFFIFAIADLHYRKSVLKKDFSNELLVYNYEPIWRFTKMYYIWYVASIQNSPKSTLITIKKTTTNIIYLTIHPTCSLKMYWNVTSFNIWGKVSIRCTGCSKFEGDHWDLENYKRHNIYHLKNC